MTALQPVSARPSRELGLRIASAMVLIPFGVGVVTLGGWWLAIACAAFAGLMGREWSRMAGLRPPLAVAFLATLPVLVAAAAPAMWSLAALAFSVLMAAALGRGRARERALSAFGVIYTGLPPLAMFLLRDSPSGLLLTMVVMVFVWITDISAYFAGRGFGGPLLSPRESPNKRWSGALAAFSMTMLAGMAVALVMRLPVLAWVVAALSISVACQLGDLLESRFKRAFGVKDAGSIIPGHGGLLDRVDGLSAALCYTLLVFTLAPQARILLGLST